MARKTIPESKKTAAVLRILGAERTVNEERLRLSVSPEVVRRWVKAYKEAHPEVIDKRQQQQEAKQQEAAAAAPLKPEHEKLAHEIADKVEHVTETALKLEADGKLNQEALNAALKADGDITSSQRTPTGTGQTGQVALSTEAEDMDCVLGYGHQVMGIGTRGMIFVYELIYGAKVSAEDGKRLQELYLLTPTEKEMLKPTSRHVARWLREKIGGDSNVSLSAAGSTIATGLWDRARAIGEAVAHAVGRKRAEMAAAESVAAKGGAA